MAVFVWIPYNMMWRILWAVLWCETWPVCVHRTFTTHSIRIEPNEQTSAHTSTRTRTLTFSMWYVQHTLAHSQNPPSVQAIYLNKTERHLLFGDRCSIFHYAACSMHAKIIYHLITHSLYKFNGFTVFSRILSIDLAFQSTDTWLIYIDFFFWFLSIQFRPRTKFKTFFFATAKCDLWANPTGHRSSYKIINQEKAQEFHHNCVMI